MMNKEKRVEIKGYMCACVLFVMTACQICLSICLWVKDSFEVNPNFGFAKITQQNIRQMGIHKYTVNTILSLPLCNGTHTH